MPKTFDEVADALAAGMYAADGRSSAGPDLATPEDDLYARTLAAAEEAKQLVRDSLEKTRLNVEELGRKTIVATRAQSGDSVVLLNDLLAAKTLLEALEAQTASARRRSEAGATRVDDTGGAEGTLVGTDD